MLMWGTCQCSSLLHGPSLGLQSPPAAPGAGVGAANTEATDAAPAGGPQCWGCPQQLCGMACVLQGVS